MRNQILLLEGNHQLRKSLRQRLEKYYHVNEITDGRSAITMASETLPDLIISDIMTPYMNGIEFCRIIKTQLETTHIPFIIISAHDEPALKMQGMESGADYYFSKPLSIDLLLITIRNIFERDMKLKQKYTDSHLFAADRRLHEEKDTAFFQKLHYVIEKNIEDYTMDVDFLCRHLYVSRSKLYKMVKRNSGQSVGEIIRKFRLKKAIQLMKDENITMNELVYRIGFQSNSNFCRTFKKEYGKPPLQFMHSLKS